MSLRKASGVLWPSFLVAIVATGCFFSLFDPHDWQPDGEAAPAAMAIYSIGFFCFWALGALASMLTLVLATPPDGRDVPF